MNKGKYPKGVNTPQEKLAYRNQIEVDTVCINKKGKVTAIIEQTPYDGKIVVNFSNKQKSDESAIRGTNQHVVRVQDGDKITTIRRDSNQAVIREDL